MKHKTINTIILATALSVAGLTHAVAATTTESAATVTNVTTIIAKEDGRGKHHGGKHHRGGQMKTMGFHKLDLSDQQKEEMKVIITAHKEANKELKEARKAEMKALMEDPTFNETKAAELIAQREALRADKKLEMLKVKHEMYQLLTEEQKVKYDELEMKKNKKGKKGHRGNK